MGTIAKTYKISSWGNENILKLDSGASLTTCEYSKTKTWIVHSKKMNFIIYKVYLNFFKCVRKKENIKKVTGYQ